MTVPRVDPYVREDMALVKQCHLSASLIFVTYIIFDNLFFSLLFFYIIDIVLKKFSLSDSCADNPGSRFQAWDIRVLIRKLHVRNRLAVRIDLVRLLWYPK